MVLQEIIQRFDVLCYADDVLLVSVTASGLQNLINVAQQYVSEYGLGFNPEKTFCSIYGKNPFVTSHTWSMCNQTLRISDHLEYLGAYVGNKAGSKRDNRITKCRRSFNSLQSAGLCHKGLEIQAAIHVWSASCESVLSYACESMYLKQGDKCKLDKLQARLIKCILGINANHNTKPLLSALNVNCLSERIVFRNIMLLRKILYNDSLARTFNMKMLKLNNNCEKILINRVRPICSSNGIMLYDMLFKNECVSHLRKKLLKKTPPCQDGLK